MAKGFFGEKLIEGVNADRRGGELRARDPFEAAVRPAIDALDKFGKELEGRLPEQLAQTDAEAGVTRTGLESERTRRTEEFGLQRGREEQRTESAVAEARRQGGELLQGLQARFGGTTGTGGFAGELLGRDVVRSVAANRTSLQNTIGQIDTAQGALDREVSNQLEALSVRTEGIKLQLRTNLQDRLAEINLKKGELEARKGEMRLDALREFAQFQQQLELQENSFKQNLALQRDRGQQELDFLKASTVEQFQGSTSGLNFQPINVSGVARSQQAPTGGGSPIGLFGERGQGTQGPTGPGGGFFTSNLFDDDRTGLFA